MLKTKGDHMTSPFLRICYMVIYWGCVQWHITITRFVDSLSQEFLDLLDQASWCHAGMARSLGLHRCGMGCHRLGAGAFF